MYNNILEEHAASILRVKQQTNEEMSIKQPASRVLLVSCFILATCSSETSAFAGLHGITSYKKGLFIASPVRALNPTRVNRAEFPTNFSYMK
jgi:hypothetical protein